MTLVLILLFSLLNFVKAQDASVNPAAGTGSFPDDPVRGLESLSYEELVDLALRHGLPANGNRLVLEARLADALDEQPMGVENLAQPGQNLATIEQSDSGRYFSPNGRGELELLGNVVLAIQDENSGVIHRILADRILYNQDLRQLSAEGNLDYRMTSASQEDRFTGERLLFLLDENETLFVEGEGSTLTEPESEAFTIFSQLHEDARVQYFYQGEFITRNQNQVVILDRGNISSGPNSLYKLEFRKLWIMAPGEWGIEGARLSAGHIPLIGFPFLYIPGNEVVFHPVFILSDFRGQGLNTTTWLAGRRDPASAPFSFMQIAGDSEPEGLRREGIFLEQSSSPGPETWAQKNFEEMAVILDAYSLRGVSLGLSSLLQFGSGSRFEALAALAFTREIYRGSNGEYTALYNSGEGSLQSVWHDSNLFSIALPFRYILDLTTSLQYQAANFSLKLPLYSDPLIFDEISRRRESTPWDELIFGGSTSTVTESFSSRQMNWELSMSLSPPVPSFLSPFITGFRLGNLVSSVSWFVQSRPSDNDEHLTAISSPVLLAYAPRQFQFPSGQTSLSGTLLQYPWPDASTDQASDAPGTGVEWFPEDAPGFIQPDLPDLPDQGDETSPGSDEKTAYSPGFVAPPGSRIPAAPAAGDPFRYNLSYSGSNNHFLALLFEDFDSDNFQASYYNFQNTLTANLNQSMQIFGNLLSLQNQLRYSGSFRDIIVASELLDQNRINELERGARAQEKQSLTFTNQAGMDLLSLWHTDSRLDLKYTLNGELWSSSTDSEGNAVTEAFSWDNDHISAHQVGLSYRLPLVFFHDLLSLDLLADLSQTVSVDYRLPPLDESIGLLYGLQSRGYSLSVKSSIDDPGSDPRFNGLDIDSSLRFSDTLSLNGSLSWELNPFSPTDYNASLRAGWFSSALFFEEREILEVNEDRTAWIRTGTRDFMLSRGTAGLAVPSTELSLLGGSLKAGVSAALSHDFVDFSRSSLSFRLNSEFLLPGLFRFSLSSTSANNQMYRYIPFYAEQLGQESRNIIVDLVESINFFNPDSRRRSQFKLQNLNFSLLHDLGDWMMRLEYAWVPRLVQIEGGLQDYRLENSFSFFLQWLPISEIKSEIDLSIQEDEWTLEY